MNRKVVGISAQSAFRNGLINDRSTIALKQVMGWELTDFISIQHFVFIEDYTLFGKQFPKWIF